MSFRAIANAVLIAFSLGAATTLWVAPVRLCFGAIVLACLVRVGEAWWKWRAKRAWRKKRADAIENLSRKP